MPDDCLTPLNATKADIAIELAKSRGLNSKGGGDGEGDVIATGGGDGTGGGGEGGGTVAMPEGVADVGGGGDGGDGVMLEGGGDGTSGGGDGGGLDPVSGPVSINGVIALPTRPFTAYGVVSANVVTPTLEYKRKVSTSPSVSP